MADISVNALAGFGLATILPRSGVGADAIGAALGVAVRNGPVASYGAGIAFWGTGPGQWLAHTDQAAPDWADGLAQTLTDVAAVVDQSGAYSLFAVSGAQARDLLQKGLPVDLSPQVFGPGAVVVSAVAHIGVIVHQVTPERFDLAIFRSFTRSFREWLDASIAAL